MKHHRILNLLLVLAVVAGLLSGCGKSTNATAETAAAYGIRDSAAQVVGAVEAVEAAMEESEWDTGGELTQPENRKWIITVEMSAETEDLDALLPALTEQIGALSGYVEDQSIYNGSAYSSRRYRYGSMTVRIPAEDVDGFTQAVSGIANVISSSKTLEDVTLQYSDTETRVKALETEQSRLLELMEQAETVADLLEIEERLTQVRYELESYSSRLKLYDNQIEYATIYLDISEVQEYTPVEQPSVWQRISTGFVSSLKGLGNGAVNVAVWLIVSSPYILAFAALGAGLFFLLRRIRRNRKK